MMFDPDRYRHHLDAFDMSEDQKLALMQSLWTIMESFVDRAFGDSPEQMLGLLPRDIDTNPPRFPLSSSPTTTKFNHAAHEDAARKKTP